MLPQPTARPPANSTGSSTTGKIVLYETLISFLRDTCKAKATSKRSSQVRKEAIRIQDLLDGYSASMASNSVVQALIRSLENKRILLDLSSQLGLATDAGLRDCLRADEDRISAHIVSVFDSASIQQEVLALEGDAAQGFLDLVQQALDRGYLIDQEHAQKGHRIVRKLSEACDKLPSSLFITKVIERDAHPRFGGGFGDVYRARYQGRNVALKHMRHFMRGSELRGIRLRLCREALVWKDLHHPNILPFIGIDRETFPDSLCMVSPWMENGTVLAYLNVHGRANVNKLLFEIAQGIQYLHSRNIVHGDLRGANILIKEDWVACLADFGLSSFTDLTSRTHTSNRAGSLYWMAPELIDPDRFGRKFIRTPATDVYAFGCVCFELCTGRPPFSELSETAALFRIIGGERAERPAVEQSISDGLWSEITRYWAEDPVNRPTIEIVLQNPVWPKQISAEDLKTVEKLTTDARLPPAPRNASPPSPPPQEKKELQAPQVSEQLQRRSSAEYTDISSINSVTLPTPPQNKADSSSTPLALAPSPKVFGVHWEDSLKYAGARIRPTYPRRDWLDPRIYGSRIPIVVAKCGLYLKSYASVVEPEIFISDSHDLEIPHAEILSAQFEQPPLYGRSLDFTDFTVHDTAIVFLRYLTQLPEPLIPFRLYSEMRYFMENPGAVSSQEDLLLRYKVYLNTLTHYNAALLLFTLELLSAVARRSMRKYSAQLAEIFQPALFLPPADSNLPPAPDIDKRVVRLLIRNSHRFMFRDQRPDEASSVLISESKASELLPRGGFAWQYIKDEADEPYAVRFRKRTMRQLSGLQFTLRYKYRRFINKLFPL